MSTATSSAVTAVPSIVIEPVTSEVRPTAVFAPIPPSSSSIRYPAKGDTPSAVVAAASTVHVPSKPAAGSAAEVVPVVVGVESAAGGGSSPPNQVTASAPPAATSTTARTPMIAQVRFVIGPANQRSRRTWPDPGRPPGTDRASLRPPPGGGSPWTTR